MSRLAFFAPLAPVRSALADHAHGIIPHLARHFDITVVTSGTYTAQPVVGDWPGAVPVPQISYRAFQSRPNAFDLVIYQMGDEAEIHGYMLDALARFPGLVLLNDLVMHHAIIGRTLRQGHPAQYIEEMRYSYGEEGARIAERLILDGDDEVTWRLPLVERILDQSLAVAGFNGYMCNQIRVLRPELPCRMIPYPFYLPPGFPADYDPAGLRSGLGLARRPVIASFGFFIPDKRLRLVMRAFKRVLNTHPDAFYLLVGGSSPHYDLTGELRAEGLADNVALTGWQDPISFVKHMLVTDIAVHLRWPHIGGTLYTPIRLLGLGIPTIVSDIEPLAELPADAVVRVTPNVASEETDLAAAMNGLLDDRTRAESMAAAGRQYVSEELNMERIVASYVSYIAWALDNRLELLQAVDARRAWTASPEPCSGYTRAIRSLAETLAGMGATAQDEAWLRPVANAIEALLDPNESQAC